MRLDEGWNQIQFNLSDFTRRAYGTNYIETLRVQVIRNALMRHGIAQPAAVHTRRILGILSRACVMADPCKLSNQEDILLGPPVLGRRATVRV